MKQLLLLGVAAFLSANASAQLANNSIVKLNGGRVADQQTIPARGKYVRPVDNSTASKTTATTTRWYSHLETMGDIFGVPDVYDETYFGLNAMWQDSTVRFSDPAAPGGVSARGINWLSIGAVFHPQTGTFTNPSPSSNNGQQLIGATDAYTVDSVRILGRYERLPGSTTTDTLIFTMVPESTLGRFPFYSYGGSVEGDHGVDSFKAQLWSRPDYSVRPINQISFSTGGNSLGTAVQYKMPLTAAVFADSLASGYHLLKAPMNVAVPAGRQAGLSITFKSGAPYTAGTSLENYNFFAFGSGETVPGGFVTYLPNDFNMSSVLYKDTAGASVNATLAIYTPAIAWTAPYTAEIHAIEFKATCTTCNTVGGTTPPGPGSVGTINGLVGSVVAFPNPSSTQLFVPVTLSKAADLSVTLSTPMGQVVARQDFGTVAAGQEMKATFNTAALANGVYFYTVEVAGERLTNRVVVSH
jgi:hypothetical protein